MDAARRFAGTIGLNRAVLALSVARMGDSIGNSLLFIIIPLYVAKLPSPLFPLSVPVLVGLLISLYGLVNSFLQPVFGALIDRLDRRKAFIQVGLLVMAGGTLAFAWADRYLDLIVLRSLQGVGVACTVPASMAILTAVTEKQTRGSAMGVFTTFRMAGFAVGPLVGGFLVVHVGFDAAFYAGTALIALGMVLVQVWVREVPAGRAERRPFRLVDRELMTPAVLALGTATFLMASSFSMMTTLENEFNERLRQTAVGFSIAFSALMVSRFVFQVPLGWVSDRIGRKPLIIGGMLLMAPATALLGEAGTTFELIVLRLLQGLGSAGIAAPTFALAADLAKAGGEGRQLSIITMGFGLGIAIGPLVAGLLAEVFFDLPFLVGGASLVLGAIIVYGLVPETVRRRRKTGRAWPSSGRRGRPPPRSA